MNHYTVFTGAALLGTACIYSEAHAVPKAKPNLLVILADDLGFSDLGCYGSEMDTPRLDHLAADGLRFTQFYTTAKCHSSRICILTGRYPYQAGNRSLSRAVTVPEMLGAAGYFTAMTGKWHLQQEPTDFGFDRYFGHLSGSCNYFTGDDTFRLNGQPWQVPATGFYTTVAKVDFALEFLDEARAGKKPWFLYIAFNAPHSPLQPLEEDYRKYLGRYDEGWDLIRAERVSRQEESGLFQRTIQAAPRPDHIPPWDSLSPQEQSWESRRMAAYAALVDRMDQEIGRLVDNLRSAGELENTLILFFSDNGANPYDRRNRGVDRDPFLPETQWNTGTGWAWVSNTPFRLYKQNQFEGGITTPAIIHWPAGLKTEPGTVTDIPAHLIDVLPTAAEVADVPIPSSWPGRELTPVAGVSLVPVFEGKELPPRPLYFLYNTDRAVRDADWKLVSFQSNPWELYNLADDRTELNNLAGEMPEMTERLERLWFQMAEEVDTAPAGRRRPILTEEEETVHPLWTTFRSVPETRDRRPSVRDSAGEVVSSTVVVKDGGNEMFRTDFSNAEQAGTGGPIQMGGIAGAEIIVSALQPGPGANRLILDDRSTADQGEPPVFAATLAGTNPSRDAGESLANQEYLEFTLSGEDPMVLETLRFTMVKHGFPHFAGITVRSSVDHYGSDLLTVTDSTQPGLYPASVDLSALDGFDRVRSVTFRFYLYNEYAGQNNRRLGIDQIRITGFLEP